MLGSSGCGKSTILKMISGIESVTDGSIIMEGKDITNLDSTKREINTIFQNYALFPHMTIEDNKYENIISKYTEQQLVYERAILIKQFNIIKKQLALLDEECKRRLEDGRK